MSKYTTEVRNIVETYAGRNERGEYPDVDSCIDLAIPQIFDVANIPVYVPEHKTLLFHKILLHYYQREIAFETTGLWKLKLNAKMKEIMPYYNQLYASELLEYDPLQNVNNWHEHQGVYEDTSKVDKLKKYDNTTDTTNSQVTENNKKYDNTTDTSDSKVANKNIGVNTTDETATSNEYDGTETTLLKRSKKTTHGQDTDTHNMTAGRDQWTLYSDTPQGGIGGLQNEPLGSGNVGNDGNNYLTNATHIIDKDGTYTDTKAYGDITETYNQGNNSPDTTRRVGSEGEATNRKIGSTQAENEGIAENGKKVDDATTHESGAKLDEGNKVDDATTTEDNLKQDNGSDAHTNREYGKIGVMTYQEMVLKYRETFLNIDMMIIDELKDLFMKVW